MTRIDPQVIAELRELQQAVPGDPVTLGLILDDKPGILSGGKPVCRLSTSPLGAPYGKLIVSALNNLTALLNAVEATPENEAKASSIAAHPLRAEVEQAIGQTLMMQNGFPRGMVTLWSRLVFAAVEPWLKGGRDVLDAQQVVQAEPAPAPRSPAAEAGDGMNAVMSFCDFLLEQDDENLPSQYAMEELVNKWLDSQKKDAA